MALETGTEDCGIKNYCRGLRDSFWVHHWQFQEVCESYLLDPLLFGDLNNIRRVHNLKCHIFKLLNNFFWKFSANFLDHFI